MGKATRAPVRGVWFLAGAALILIAAVAGTLSLWRREHLAASQAKAPVVEVPPDELSLQGKIQAAEVTLVAAPIDGVIESYMTDVGEEVYEGQLLARIKNDSLTDAFQSAQAEMERVQERVNSIESQMLAARLDAARSRADASRAREEYDRSQRVYSRQQMLNREGATPRLQYEKSEKDYLHAQTEFNSLDQLAKQAEERVGGLIESLEGVRKQIQEKNDELEVATAELQAAEVHAPTNGVIVARQGAEGAEVTRSTRDLFQIASDLSRLEVVLEPDPKARALIHEGQDAIVQVPELSDQSFPAKVKTVEESRVVVGFANPLTAIKPGLAAQVRIRVRD